MTKISKKEIMLVKIEQYKKHSGAKRNSVKDCEI